MWCRARVWGSGDTEDCGKPAGSHGLCPECYVKRYRALQQDLEKAYNNVTILRAAIDELTACERQDETTRSIGAGI